jgi:hypothetical protein
MENFKSEVELIKLIEKPKKNIFGKLKGEYTINTDNCIIKVEFKNGKIVKENYTFKNGNLMYEDNYLTQLIFSNYTKEDGYYNDNYFNKRELLKEIKIEDYIKNKFIIDILTNKKYEFSVDKYGCYFIVFKFKSIKELNIEKIKIGEKIIEYNKNNDKFNRVIFNNNFPSLYLRINFNSTVLNPNYQQT